MEENISTEGGFNRELCVNYLYMAFLSFLVLAWVVMTLISDPDSKANPFMHFIHDGRTSKIYVMLICGTLIFRMITAAFFGNALWVMYHAMKD